MLADKNVRLDYAKGLIEKALELEPKNARVEKATQTLLRFEQAWRERARMLRGIVEVGAAALAARRRTPEDLRRMRAALDAARTALDDEDVLRRVSDLAGTFIVSDVAVSAGDAAAVTIESAPGRKCARCWNHRTDVGADAEHPDLCGRCVGVVRALPSH